MAAKQSTRKPAQKADEAQAKEPTTKGGTPINQETFSKVVEMRRRGATWQGIRDEFNDQTLNGRFFRNLHRSANDDSRAYPWKVDEAQTAA
jgi:hypothetical protein